MKVAVPTRNGVVDEHFGHCDTFTVFSVGSGSAIENAEIVPSAQGCGCHSNIAATLKEKGVDVMLAGNMGDGALNMLAGHGIQVFRGCSGDARQLVENFLNGKVEDSGQECHHHHGHDEGHTCNH
jgi:predicted Fe-Mo cluster-binding NifX family protein